MLDDLLIEAAPHPLHHAIPQELSGILLDCSWNQGLLWAIDRVPQQLRVEGLRWHFDLPWWRAGDEGWFQVHPRDVMADPDQFPHHHRRIIDADLSFPISVIWRRDRWQILDGIHRAAKAELLGLDEIAAIVIDAKDLAAISDTG